jgi:putative transposase
VGGKRVARLMRAEALRGVSRRRGAGPTVAGAERRPHPDRVERDFTATAPDQLYVADITYIPTWAGFLYLAIVLDVFSRRIVGWRMATHLRTELVRGALDMALWQRRPAGVIHHSDQGCQYTSIDFGDRCREAGVRPSMGSVGDCFDNAMAESFFATLECELIDLSRSRDPDEARQAVFTFIEGWYNPRRRHSAIGYVSPIQHERQNAQVTAPTPKPETVH